MTAITTAKNRDRKEGGIRRRKSVKMGAQKIVEGAVVILDSTGYGINALAAASNKGSPGVAIETVDNSAGSPGDKSILVESGIYLLTGVGLTQASEGSHAYASDNTTCSTTQATNEPLIGTIEDYVSSTSAWVQVGPLSLVAAG